jgi:hypothetical protein
MTRPIKIPKSLANDPAFSPEGLALWVKERQKIEDYMDEWERQIEEFFDKKFAAAVTKSSRRVHGHSARQGSINAASKPGPRGRKGSEPMSIYVRNTTSGIRVRPDSWFPKRFCEGWIKSMQEYEKWFAGDWPFWYGERPLVGFLATGITGSRGICIEEYQADKKPGIEELRKRNGKLVPKDTKLGRGDLYFGDRLPVDGMTKNRRRPAEKVYREGNVEFKLHDIGISQTRHFNSLITSAWAVSKKDAENTYVPPGRGARKLGGMFLRPFVGMSRDVPGYEENLKQLLKEIWNSLSPDALAWWCPVKRVLTENKETRHWVVGVIMVIKRVR